MRLHISSICIISLLGLFISGCGTQRIIYSMDEEFIFYDLNGRNDRIIYDGGSHTLRVERGNHLFTNIDVQNRRFEQGPYDITEDIKRTDKLYLDCTANRKGETVRLQITLSYIIYDRGYGGREEYNGSPSLIYVEATCNDGSISAQGTRMYRRR